MYFFADILQFEHLNLHGPGQSLSMFPKPQGCLANRLPCSCYHAFTSLLILHDDAWNYSSMHANAYLTSNCLHVQFCHISCNAMACAQSESNNHLCHQPFFPQRPLSPSPPPPHKVHLNCPIFLVRRCSVALFEPHGLLHLLKRRFFQLSNHELCRGPPVRSEYISLLCLTFSSFSMPSLKIK